jgi:hypothetical protein
MRPKTCWAFVRLINDPTVTLKFPWLDDYENFDGLKNGSNFRNGPLGLWSPNLYLSLHSLFYSDFFLFSCKSLDDSTLVYIPIRATDSALAFLYNM